MAKPDSKPEGVTIDVGPTRVTKTGADGFRWTDAYHAIMAVSWPTFFAIAISIWMSVNVLFALAFYLERGVNNATTFLDYFFFSTETLATVGYGNMNPGTIYAHWVATGEILTGMLSIAIITSLVFARFSKPTSRILFSRVAVITPYNGVPTLMLRVANKRKSYILQANALLVLIRSERSTEGYTMRRFHELRLERTSSPLFALSWLLMHRIDETSPLHGLTLADIERDDMRLAITLSGMDEIFAAAVSARHHYAHEDILFGHRFVDVFIERGGPRDLVEDMSRFHDVEPTTA